MTVERPFQEAEAYCDGREKLTIEKARAIAKRARIDSISPYHCPHCGAWHVGQSNRRGKQMKRLVRRSGT
ncbi:MAG: hypothetical protein V4669_13820 [Pseudomonadota bacterium]